jgi:tetratricopeptide (TPR) repeat protein
VPQVLEAEQAAAAEALAASSLASSTATLTLPLLGAAELCENHQQWELALTYYQFALRSASQQQNEYWLQAAAGRARMLEQHEDLPRLAQAYRDILRHLPGDAFEAQAEFFLKLALCYQALQKLPQAAAAFDTAFAHAQTLLGVSQDESNRVLHADHV